MSAAVTALRAAGVPAVRACALTGASRATLHRRATRVVSVNPAAAQAPGTGVRVEGPAASTGGPDAPTSATGHPNLDATDADATGGAGGAGGIAPARARRVTSQSLTEAERAHARALLTCPQYADLSIGQLWVRELDEGRYPCSLSSLYRIARQAGMTRERRRQATHPTRVVPELVAEGPCQVWTWDITKLRGPAKGIWYHLYVLIDVYSRYNPGWLLAAAEDSVVAAEFIADAIDRNGHAPHTVHADRGTSMTS